MKIIVNIIGILYIISEISIIIYYYRKILSYKYYKSINDIDSILDIKYSWIIKKKRNIYLEIFHIIIWSITLPISIQIIFFIILYQLFFSKERLYHRSISVEKKPYRYCTFVPGCSNFSIGCLLNYDFFIAMIKIIRRLKRCNGEKYEIDLP